MGLYNKGVIVKGKPVPTKNYIIEKLPYADKYLRKTTDFDPSFRSAKKKRSLTRKSRRVEATLIDSRRPCTCVKHTEREEKPKAWERVEEKEKVEDD